MKKKLHTFFKGITLLSLSILFFNNGFSQTVHKEYIDGQIWFQLKADQYVEHTISQDGKVKPDLNKMKLSSFPYLRDVFTAHSIVRVHKPAPRAYGSDALMRTYHIEFADINNIDQFIAELEESGKVVYAEKVPLMTIDVVPNDPFHASQMWGVNQN